MDETGIMVFLLFPIKKIETPKTIEIRIYLSIFLLITNIKSPNKFYAILRRILHMINTKNTIKIYKK